MMWWWHGPGLGGWGFALMTIGVVLFLALIVLGVSVVARRVLPGDERPIEVRRPPEELLAERFARGEIDEEDYRRRLDTLHRGPAR